MKLTESEILQNKVNAINAMHSAINSVVPKLIARLQQGYKCKNDGSLYEKDKKDIDAILAEYKDKCRRLYLDASVWSITLDVDNIYRVGECSYEYVKRCVWLCSKPASKHDFEFTPLWDCLSCSEYKDIESFIEEKQKIISKLQREIMTAKREIYL